MLLNLVTLETSAYSLATKVYMISLRHTYSLVSYVSDHIQVIQTLVSYHLHRRRSLNSLDDTARASQKHIPNN